MLAIVGASGKIGGATLSSLLSENLISATEIVCTTSAQPSTPKWNALAAQGVQVRHATFDDPSSMETAFQGCDALFLVSSPRVRMDFDDAPHGQGREKDHFVALDAAKKADVRRIYYTSLAFADPSRSNVMTAHERTEERLRDMGKEGMEIVILREGLYNDSWPLYLGHYEVGSDDRNEILVAGDGKIAWTAIEDLGLGTALIIAEKGDRFVGETLYLSNTKNTKTLKQVAETVSKTTGKQVELKVVTREEHEKFYTDERKMDPGNVKWWAGTYDALKDGECDVKDTTLEKLLERRGRKMKPVEQTIREMLS